eukprot:TRINITY_DN4471_c0_g1_i1.p1 TRINITY_DN4471_c0_g1~~TRINITY_DN4471_c0_g1_i1.p1  ORF type:complete len:368 (-),score=55.51 TRINITY_DN4471_c0_g1_i1:68-1150(-)
MPKKKDDPDAQPSGAFLTQSLAIWQPQISPPWVASCFFCLTALLVPIGAAVIAATRDMVEIEIPYGASTVRKTPGQEVTTWVHFTVPKRMRAPVHLFYKLDGFMQTYNKYAKSVNHLQLRGEKVTLDLMSKCSPLLYAGELSGASSPSNSDISKAYSPCGLLAYSMFNDTLDMYVSSLRADCSVDRSTCTPVCSSRLFKDPTNPYYCVKKGIAWTSDVADRFKLPYNGGTASNRYISYPSEYANEPGHLVPLQTDEDFMVWMRLASGPVFRKLYRRFPTYTFEAGQLVYMRITDRFEVNNYGAKKAFILASSSWIGTKSWFFGISFVVVGGLCFFVALAVLAKYFLSGAKELGVPNPDDL